MALLLFFALFYVLGIVLWITRKYDLFTISLVFIICAVFLGFGNLEMFLYILIFFCVAEGVPIILKKKFKYKDEKRSYKNLLGNCLAGTVFMAIGFPVVAIASIGASFADTMSSEIGLLSKRKPRLITTFKEVEPGTDGGITIIGCLTAITISALTVLYFYVVPSIIESTFIYTTTILIVLFVCGVFGSFVDSLIGATLEQKGLSNNYQTNFMASALSGLLALLIIYIL